MKSKVNSELVDEKINSSMNKKTLTDLLSLGEGFTTEFKRSGTSGLGREICAFANAMGGTILLGVADDGQVCGVANHNRLKSEVQSIARSADPPIAVEIESMDGVLCVRVPRPAEQALLVRGQVLHPRGVEQPADVA